MCVCIYILFKGKLKLDELDKKKTNKMLYYIMLPWQLN